jgi:hypothetical protein
MCFVLHMTFKPPEAVFSIKDGKVVQHQID